MIVSLLFVSLNSNSLYRWIEMVLIISNIFLGKIILLKLNLSQARDLSARASDHLRHKKLNTTPEFNNMLNSRIGWSRVNVNIFSYFCQLQVLE